jgi:thiol:disulfide interchange protein DsbD
MIAAALLFLAAPAPAIPKVIVTVKGPEPVAVVVGGQAKARITATVAEGFSIQANPAAQPYLIPASLDLEDDERVRVGPVEYPPGRPHRLRGADSDLSIYQGTFVLRVPVEATPVSDGEPVETVLEGTLRYQACNDVVCLKPASVPVSLPVRIHPAR